MEPPPMEPPPLEPPPVEPPPAEPPPPAADKAGAIAKGVATSRHPSQMISFERIELSSKKVLKERFGASTYSTIEKT
jgi:hypothetical protein